MNNIRQLSCAFCQKTIGFWARVRNTLYYTNDGFGPLCKRCYGMHQKHAPWYDFPEYRVKRERM